MSPTTSSRRTSGSRDKRDKIWLSWQKTKGPSDVYVQSNVWAPGGSSGWHTHPGHSLITVTAGTVTAYHGDDCRCRPHVYTQGMGFVDAGGDHVHNLRNEGTEEARTITVQLIPADATRRIDAPDPGNCPFLTKVGRRCAGRAPRPRSPTLARRRLFWRSENFSRGFRLQAEGSRRRP